MTSAAAKLELQGLPDLLQWVDFGTCAVIFLPSCRWLIPLIGQINAPSSASLQVVLTEPCADTVLECAPKYPLNNPKLQSAELVTMRPSAKPPFKRFADAFPFLSKDAGLVIFAGGMEAFDRLSSAQLNALLVNLANDASDGAKAVLLCLGGLSAELKQHILNSRRAVSCAAAIEKQGDHFVWITNFWHAMDHYCDEVTLPLSFDADGRLLIDSENNRGSSLERSDEDVVWSSVSGDMGCVMLNRAVLFLSGCRPSTLEITLRRIFSVDPTLIFQSYAGFFTDLEVANGLQQLEDFLERGKPSRRAYSRPITNRKPNPDDPSSPAELMRPNPNKPKRVHPETEASHV